MLPMIEDTALLKRTRAIYRALGLPTRAGANKEKVLAYTVLPPMEESTCESTVVGQLTKSMPRM